VRHAAALLCCGLLAGACETSTPAGPKPAASAKPAPAAALASPTPAAALAVATPAPAAAAASAPSERHFGQPPALAGAPIPVEQLLAAPEPHLGQRVKCQGKVARVCQAAGCWLELQAASGGPGLRVPMADHAFFIPQDALGQQAVVEGNLLRQELPAAQREHYEGEGMKATGPLSLEATGVVLR
jgi:hypothetical protein